MKKTLTALLSAALCVSMPAAASAADMTQDSPAETGTTVLTATKEAAYTVVIPETAEIVFDTEINPIGAVEYREGNLEPDAYVTVTLEEQTPLANRADDTYTIPYEICDAGGTFGSVTYEEQTTAGTQTPLTANITREAWEKAKAGKYTASLTFSIRYTDPHAGTVSP